MNWFLTIFICIFLVELAVRMPFLAVISKISLVTRKVLHTLGTKSVSDHWKEKAIWAYAVSLFKLSINLAIYWIAIIGLAFLIIFTFDYLGARVGDFVTSWEGIFFSSIVATLYFIVRRLFVKIQI